MRAVKSSLFTKLLVLAVVVYSVIKIVSLQPGINEMKKQSIELEQQIAAAAQSNLELQSQIENINTDEAVIEIARERLNLVQDGEMVFIDSSK